MRRHKMVSPRMGGGEVQVTVRMRAVICRCFNCTNRTSTHRLVATLPLPTLLSLIFIPLFSLCAILMFMMPSIGQVEKVLDAKWFKMERERWPDGFDPATFVDSQEEDENEDEDDMVRRVGVEVRGREGGGGRAPRQPEGCSVVVVVVAVVDRSQGGMNENELVCEISVHICVGL